MISASSTTIAMPAAQGLAGDTQRPGPHKQDGSPVPFKVTESETARDAGGGNIGSVLPPAGNSLPVTEAEYRKSLLRFTGQILPAPGIRRGFADPVLPAAIANHRDGLQNLLLAQQSGAATLRNLAINGANDRSPAEQVLLALSDKNAATVEANQQSAPDLAKRPQDKLPAGHLQFVTENATGESIGERSESLLLARDRMLGNIPQRDALDYAYARPVPLIHEAKRGLMDATGAVTTDLPQRFADLSERAGVFALGEQAGDRLTAMRGATDVPAGYEKIMFNNPGAVSSMTGDAGMQATAVTQAGFVDASPATAQSASSSLASLASTATADTAPADAAYRAALTHGAEHLPEDLGNRVLWMIGQKRGAVHVRLDPPELGSLELRVSIGDDETKVQILTQNSDTKQLLESTLPRLREVLQSMDLGNVHAEVTDQAPEQASDSENTSDHLKNREQRATGTGDDGSHAHPDEALVVKRGILDAYA